MLRRLLDFQLSFFEKGKPLYRMRPFVSAVDAFCYEAPLNTKRSPHIRDAIDLKRWMFIVIFALIPTILMAIWNTGVQQFVYTSGNYKVMEEFLHASTTFKGYFQFTFSEGHWLTILKYGSLAFLPIMLISYLVGGLCEGIVAAVRGHEIAEGFLVTGMLYPLILPPSIPYWMVAVGIAFGVIVGKELFGGTGMNILNPALTARAFLFFTFPGKMTGDIWIGTNSSNVTTSLNKMNVDAKLSTIDGFSQSSALQKFNVATNDIKRIHVDTIATNTLKDKVPTYETIQAYHEKWNATGHEGVLGDLSIDQMSAFVTGPLEDGGLGLLPSSFGAANGAVDAIHGLGKFTNGNLFFGNVMGSMGETSTLACLLGAFILIYLSVGSWRTMLSFGVGAFLTAYLFQFFSTHFGVEGGAWNPARFAMPAYKHFIMGSLAFGLVYMATDPVSSPTMSSSKWIYGGLIGLVTIAIRVINPAYPEGVMLAILFANVFAPLIDYYAVRNYRRGQVGRAIYA